MLININVIYGFKKYLFTLCKFQYNIFKIIQLKLVANAGYINNNNVCFTNIKIYFIMFQLTTKVYQIEETYSKVG